MVVSPCIGILTLLPSMGIGVGPWVGNTRDRGRGRGRPIGITVDIDSTLDEIVHVGGGETYAGYACSPPMCALWAGMPPPMHLDEVVHIGEGAGRKKAAR